MLLKSMSRAKGLNSKMFREKAPREEYHPLAMKAMGVRSRNPYGITPSRYARFAAKGGIIAAR
jgi:hypothetical protein